jgi:ATP-binding cassette subfamily C protein LapB
MTIGRPGASDEDVRRALHLAGMDTFVAANPAGLDLYIGEKGNRLSGGQRQGVALARLLLRRPRILFLDEPTNAMDQQMETAFIQRIGALKAEIPTLILCTHRMSLAATAERFIVLDQGRKVLDGPKEEVMATLRAAQARQLEG